MKKLKALGALLVATTLALGSFSVVLADENVFDDLDVTARAFYNLRGAHIGVYPVIAGFDDLNEKILRDVEYAFELATDRNFTTTAGPTNAFDVSFETEDDGQFAKVVVTYSYQLTAHRMAAFDDSKTYFVDKELGEEISEEDYKAGIAAAAAEAEKEEDETEEDEVVTDDENTEPEENEIDDDDDPDQEPVNFEGVTVPIRFHSEALGYEVGWDDETKSVILSRGEAFYTITVGLNAYPLDDELVELELAPVNQDGSVFVPVSFFTQILGAEASVDEDGNIIIFELESEDEEVEEDEDELEDEDEEDEEDEEDDEDDEDE